LGYSGAETASAQVRAIFFVLNNEIKGLLLQKAANILICNFFDLAGCLLNHVFLGCIECMGYRLLLSMIVVFVSLSVMQLNSVWCIRAAFVKLLWLLVGSLRCAANILWRAAGETRLL